MQHLTPLDAGFLEIEDSDPHVSLAIAAVAIIEGPAPSQEEFLESVADRLSSVPHALQKVRMAPFYLTAPTWVDDPNFELGHHFRRTALPEPGDDAALSNLVARVMAQRLDRDRPLWECWVIEGLADGRWAVLAKVHHCMADGIAGARLFEAICDLDPAEIALRHIGDGAPVVSDGLVDRVLKAAKAIPTNPSDQFKLVTRGAQLPWRLTSGAFNALKGLAGIAGGFLVPSASTSLLGSIGRQRRYAVSRTSMSEIREIGRVFDATVNDVALAAVTGALRTVLLQRGEQPSANSVRTLVPVSVRSKDAADIMDNRVSLMLPFLPVEIADPIDQLAAVHVRMSAHKAGGQAEAGHGVTALAEYWPFAPVAWTVRVASLLPQRGIDIVATNVPGPRTARSVLGRKVIEILPYVPIAMRLRMGIAILSYADRLSFGITGDYDSAPDVAVLAKLIEEHMSILVERAHATA